MTGGMAPHDPICLFRDIGLSCTPQPRLQKPGFGYTRLRNHCGKKPDPRGGKLLYSRFGVKQKTRKIFSHSNALLIAFSIIIISMAFKNVGIARMLAFSGAFCGPVQS
jgi:hypothetical protein